MFMWELKAQHKIRLSNIDIHCIRLESFLLYLFALGIY